MHRALQRVQGNMLLGLKAYNLNFDIVQQKKRTEGKQKSNRCLFQLFMLWLKNKMNCYVTVGIRYLIKELMKKLVCGMI